jgi:(R,R)-butanediol dehydrogenase/meso-butanediol dehydrogenase/diacetyl reductase
MKAARWYKARDIRVENVEEPKVTAGHVKIEVAWAGICGSDLHEYAAGPVFISANAPHPVTGELPPITMGHEFSGTVVEVGEGVTKVKPGDKVVVEPIICCGECAACRQGKYNVCRKLGFVGLSGRGGGFSEYVVAEERWVHKMPEGLSLEQGALVEPAAVALHAVRQSKLKAGDKAAVFGTGPIGLLVIEALKAAGASEIWSCPNRAPRRRWSSARRPSSIRRKRRMCPAGSMNCPAAAWMWLTRRPVRCPCCSRRSNRPSRAKARRSSCRSGRRTRSSSRT